VKAYDSPSIPKTDEKHFFMRFIFAWVVVVGLRLSLPGCGANSTGVSGGSSSQTTGTISNNNSNLNGNAASSLPTPPSSAVVFSNLQDLGGWQSCDDASCAGGSGQSVYSMAQNQNQPSLDGSSMELFNSGVWANALWWQKFGAYDLASNFLWDFYINLDDSSQNAAQSLEFDGFQFVNGYNYMIGSQCNYAAGLWDRWDAASGNWSHTSIACPKFSPIAWHHIQRYMTTNSNAHQYTYVTLVVDGNVNAVNVTGNTRSLGWPDNMGVQWQLDVNAIGQGYHEWVDKAALTTW
jgi:hypothetical protein